MVGDVAVIEMVKATIEDEKEVMRVSEDVYAGLDYLPSLYHTWVREGDKEDPRRFNFVVLIDSEVGGFFSLLFSHDMSTFLSSAQRVAKEHRAKGVGKKIAEFSASFARSRNRNVEQLISFTDVWLEDVSLKKKIQNEVRGDMIMKINFQVIKYLGRKCCNPGCPTHQLQGA